MNQSKIMNVIYFHNLELGRFIADVSYLSRIGLSASPATRRPERQMMEKNPPRPFHLDWRIELTARTLEGGVTDWCRRTFRACRPARELAMPRTI